jgi:hypothetical protein
LFPSAWTPALTAGAVAAAIAAAGDVTLAAQASPALSVRFAVDSGFEAARSSTSDTAASLGGSRFAAELAHQRAARRGTLRIWSGMTADQLWREGNARSLAGAADVTGAVTLSRRMQLGFAERVSLAPLDLFGSLGGMTDAPPSVRSGSEIPSTRTLSQNGQVSLTRTTGRRSQWLVSATQMASTNDRERVVATGAAGRFQRSIGRGTQWYTGYGTVCSSSTSAANPSTGCHQNVDGGVDYMRPLSIWRGTTVGVGAGGTLMAEPQGRRIRMSAAAHLDRRLSGGWAMTVAYSRPTEYVPGVAQPLVSDTFRLGGTGRLRRIDVSIAAATASGTVGAVGGSSFTSYVVNARVSRRIGPQWRFDAEYHDSWYRFAASPGVGIPAAFARRGFRTGLVWLSTAGH